MAAAYNTPILFLVFNRPDTTQKVFEGIRKVRPTQLFIAGDGPRVNKPGEAAKCAETRKIAEKIDWPCEVHTLFRDENLGCKIAVSGAINWFFEHVEEGIILEDDCIPSPTFFSYCATMLEHYRFDDRVMHITGDGQTNGIQYGDGSYYFSPFALVWGWATWRRAWQYYDINMGTYEAFKEADVIKDIFPQENYQRFWIDKFDAVYSEKINSWAFRWLYTVMSNNGLAIIPNTNLITNIGFGDDATHTTSNSHLACKPRADLHTIVHPRFMIPNQKGIVWIMWFCFFIIEKENPLNRFAIYRKARSIYGAARKAIGLN